jgi:hypothetical protein
MNSIMKNIKSYSYPNLGGGMISIGGPIGTPLNLNHFFSYKMAYIRFYGTLPLWARYCTPYHKNENYFIPFRSMRRPFNLKLREDIKT